MKQGEVAIERRRASEGALLSLGDVSKIYIPRGRPPVEALSPLSLEVGDREFFSLVGPSGSGKTTLLKIIAGLLRPSGGEVLLRGQPVTGPVRDFGMVFQYPVLLPWRSALDNVLLPIEMLGWARAGYVKKASELLRLVGLDGFEGTRPAQLSGGMQQRVSVCRALVHDPTLLLMDEPFGALDEMTRENLNDYLLRVWETTMKTVVFVTHNISEAVYLSDRVGVLSPRPGRLIDIVSVPFTRPRSPDLRFDPEFIEITRRVQVALRS